MGDSRVLLASRSHNRGRRPQARGPRKTIEKDKCAIFSENCATLNVINSRGYTQICVGLGDSPQARLEARLEGSTHTIEKSVKINCSKTGEKTTETDKHWAVLAGHFYFKTITPQKIGPKKFYRQETSTKPVLRQIKTVILSVFKIILFQSGLAVA